MKDTIPTTTETGTKVGTRATSQIIPGTKEILPLLAEDGAPTEIATTSIINLLVMAAEAEAEVQVQEADGHLVEAIRARRS